MPAGANSLKRARRHPSDPASPPPSKAQLKQARASTPPPPPPPAPPSDLALRPPPGFSSAGHTLSPLIVDDRELTEFFLHNRPDFTGLGLYDHHEVSPVGYRTLALASPQNHACQILIAEAARALFAADQPSSRPLASPRRLNVLKGRVVRSMNQALTWTPRSSSPVDLVAAAVGLAVYDLVHGDGTEAKVHLLGVQRVAEQCGGVRVAMRDGPAVRNLLHYVESFAAYYHDYRPAFAAESLDFVTNHDAAHPLRLASMPLRSGLTPAQLRNHHLISFAGPDQAILRAYRALEFLHHSFFDLYAMSPEIARCSAQQLEGALLPMIEPPPNSRLPIGVYSADDSERQNLLLRVGCRVGLLTVAKFYAHIEHESIAGPRLDHAVQGLIMLKPWTLAGDDGPAAVALWASMIATAHANEIVKPTLVSMLRPLVATLGLDSWDACKALLQGVFYCPQTLDAAVEPLWHDVSTSASGQDDSRAQRGGLEMVDC